MKRGDAETSDTEDDEIKTSSHGESYIGILAKNAPRKPWRVLLRSIFFPGTNTQINQFLGRSVAEGKLRVDWLDGLSLVMIIVNTILLALTDPLYPDSSFSDAMNKVDWAFSFFFFTEVIIRLASFGFIVFKADLWNVFDALVVVISMTSSVLEILQFSPFSLNSLRAVRVLRPLRSIRLIESARLMILASIRAVRSLTDVGLLYLLFLILFGVSGVSQYNSRIRTRCINADFNHPNKSLALAALGNATYGGDIISFIRFNAYERDVRSAGVSVVEEHCYKPRRCAELYRDAHAAWKYDAEPDWDRFNSSGCMKFVLPGALPSGRTTEWPPLLNNTPLFDITNVSVRQSLAYFPPYFRRIVYAYDCLYQTDPILLLPSMSNAFDHMSDALQPWDEWEPAVWREHTCDGTNALLLKGYKCPQDYECIKVENPFFGIFGFDNLAQALLTLFVSVTLQVWYEILYMAMDAIDPTTAVYFIAVIVLGAFFLVNLAVVLITVEFERCSNEERERLVRYGATRSVLLQRVVEWWNAMSTKVTHRINVEKEVAKIRRAAETVLQSVQVQIAINLLILLNVVLMATEHHGMSSTLVSVLDGFNLAFTIIFTVELVLRLIATEFTEFIRSVMNLIDVAVIFVSWLDIADDSFRIPMVRAFRAFRLLNVFKSFPQMYRWITIIIHSLRSSFLLTLMIAFTLFVFATLGMNLFGGKFCNLNIDDPRPDNSVSFCLNRPRANFDSIVSAMITSFIIMTADAWEDIMLNGIRARGEVFSIFFISFFVISNYVLVNLLIGILLSVRAEAEAEELDDDAAFLEEEAARLNMRSDLMEEQPQFSKIQVSLQAVVTSTAFQFWIIFVIVLSSFCLAFESPTAAPDTTNEQILRWVDVVCNLVFVAEAVLSMAAFGIVAKRWCYLRRDAWNLFDFALVALALIGWLLDAIQKGDNTAGPLRALRVLRAVRPFRFIKRSTGLKLVISTLTQSVKPLGNLLVVIIIVFLMWGIMGVQLFKGTFYSCSVDAFKTRAACEAAGASWENADMHFDHLPAALLSLFTVATLEGWASIMFDGIDAVDVDHAPEVNYRRRNSLYFISFVIIGGFFFVNLFVSIIIDSYQKASQKDGSLRSRFLTPAQAAWIRSQHLLVARVPTVDYDVIRRDSKVETCFARFRVVLRRLVRHPLFDVVIYCCIVVNFMVMAVDQYPKSDTMGVFIIVMHTTFAVIFTIEATLKIIAEGWSSYISSKWNKFDFFIVSLSVGAILLEFAFSSASFAATFRTMRALRLLRVIRKSRRLQSVLKKFLFALYSLKNVAAVLLLLYFSFAVMGIKLFGRVQRNADVTNRANFETLPNAMLMLLRVSTGGNWGNVMNACAIQPPLCSKHIDSCGLNVIAQVYFVAFLLMSMFIMINLFVAVILESFSQMADEMEIISDWDAQQLLKLWLHFDPERTYRMESRFLLTFLRAIPPTCLLGMGEIPRKRRLQHEYVFLESLQLKETDGLIELQDLIYALCQRAYQEQLPEKRRRVLVHKTDRKFRREDRDRFKPRDSEKFDVAQRFTVMFLEAMWQRRQIVQANRAKFKLLRQLRTGEVPAEEPGLLPLLSAPPLPPSSSVGSGAGRPGVRFDQSPSLSSQAPGDGAGSGGGGDGQSLRRQRPLTLHDGVAGASAAAAAAMHKKTDGDLPTSHHVSSAIEPMTIAEAARLMQQKAQQSAHSNAGHVFCAPPRDVPVGQEASSSWVVRGGGGAAPGAGGGRAVPGLPTLFEALSAVDGIERMTANDLLAIAMRKLQNGEVQPIGHAEMLEVAEVVRRVQRGEEMRSATMAATRAKVESAEATRRAEIVAAWWRGVEDPLNSVAARLRDLAENEAEAML